MNLVPYRYEFDLRLEIDLGALRHETQRVVERHVVSDHRAKDHLVVAALRAAEPAGHPGVDEDGDALVIPPRRRRPRRGEVPSTAATPDARRSARPCPGTAPEHPIPPDGLVHRHDVHQLVVHQRRHPLVGGNRLEGEVERCDLNRHQVARHGAGRALPASEKSARRTVMGSSRIVPEQPALELRGRSGTPRATCGTRYDSVPSKYTRRTSGVSTVRELCMRWSSRRQESPEGG